MITQAKFPLGRIVSTPNALDSVPNTEILSALERHASGDWGDLDEHDREANEQALIEGFRILSAYRSKSGVKFWIITEHDRSATTVLLPEDY